MATGRNGSRSFAKTRREVIDRDAGQCFCGHGGALTVDHIIPHSLWPPGVPGVDDASNLRAAHGSRSPRALDNPCIQCGQLDPQRWPRGRLCNQSRGTGKTRTPPDSGDRHSRRW